MKPHIIIDARLYGPKHTGIGRYTKNLLLALSKTKNFNNFRFTLIIYPELKAEILQDLRNKYNYFCTTIRHYTLKEQLFLPFLIYRLKPDLIHFTHFNKPLLYRGKSVITIHDLIKHFSRGQNTTTKGPFLYWLKYLGYLILTKTIIRQNYIIVPSNYWRNFIIKKYHLDNYKIVTTYEAVDPSFLSLKSLINQKNENYLLYTGNLYPHKNIDIILKSLKNFPNIKLKIISARNVFFDRFKSLTKKYNVYRQVDFLGFVPDNKFPQIYSHAIALVHPALLEGFSLTGLEAMALNCPVISSNSSCLPEIYQDSVLYFDPKSSQQLSYQINILLKHPEIRNLLIKKGNNHYKKFSWDNTAKTTFSYYQRILNENT